MTWKRCVAQFENIVFHLDLPRFPLRLENHVGNHDRTGDRILPRPHQRHTHLRVSVANRLDLFRMLLQSADIDDATLTAGEIITAAAPFDDIAVSTKPSGSACACSPPT